MIRYLNKKKEYRYHDRDDPDYYGIRDTESLLGDVDADDYYKPILVKTTFKEDEKMKVVIGLVINYMKVEEIKTKCHLWNNILSR